ISSDASTLIYASPIGGNNDWEGFYGVGDDGTNIFFTGHTYSSDFPVSTNAYDTTLGGDTDVIVLTYSFTGPGRPTLVSPADGATVIVGTPTLSAQYQEPDAGDTGFVQYRVSSGSAADCLNNVNIVFSGTSA